MREFAAGSKGLSCELSALSMGEGEHPLAHLHTCVYRWCRGRQAGAYSGIT